MLAELDIEGISFYAEVVFGIGKNLSFKSVLGCCGVWINSYAFKVGRWYALQALKHI